MLNEQLKRIRKANRLTQLQLAEVIGIERSTYASYETGRNRPDVALLEKIAKVFGVTVDFIINIDTVGDFDFTQEREKYAKATKETLFCDLNAQERQLIAMYRLCDGAEKQKTFDEIKDKVNSK